MKSRLIYFINILRRYRHAALIAFAGRIVLFILSGIAIGLLSAWYTIEKGSPLTTSFSGSWHLWTSDGTVGADPYTLAHMSRTGRLPITSSNALYFIATKDKEGREIKAGCDYVLQGKPLDSDWWSLALYHHDGTSLQNHSHRSSVNSATLLRHENGRYEISLTRRARPGNWIEIAGHQPLVLMLRLYGIHASKDTQRSNSIEENLPIIRRLDCS